MHLARRFNNHANGLFNEFDRLFRHTLGRAHSARFLPREFGLYETEDSWILRTDLPGLRKEDLNVELTDSVLHVAGASSDDRVDTEISQSIQLPDEVNPETISAKLEHGVLELTLPKAEPDKPQTINIDVN